MRLLYIILFSLFFFTNISAQVSYSRTGHVHVSSQNSIKTIEADNYQIITTLNFESGEINFEGLLKSFEFRLGALDRVFNSERINVNQYPKIKFEGKILGYKNLELVENKEVEVQVKGILYIWDEKRVTRAKGTLKKLPNGEIHALSDFSIKIEEASMHKLNDLIDQKLPDILNVSTESFGVSRDININLDVNYIPRNW
ncbi:MAG: hypothetical protein HKO66_04455 [Saprospiraceae bacterium]|nr:hypothetical protein [Bacteroidia bacterium]NNE14539.1 hypothetical protein [Saprospiraceae bacterium]NNL91461.1 hypothetical protein [Saprospiraceae bacterium]